MDSILEYGSSDEEKSSETTDIKVEQPLHLKPLTETCSNICVKADPVVLTHKGVFDKKLIDHTKNKEIFYNPTYDELHLPEQGPANPFKTNQQLAKKNMLSGFVEETYIDDFQFETQRRTFESYGFCIDPSADEAGNNKIIVSTTKFQEPDEDEEEAKVEDYNEKMKKDRKIRMEQVDGKTVFEKIAPRPQDKRKRLKNNDPSDVDGYLGPWGGFVDEERVSKPSKEMQKELDEIVAKRQKKGTEVEEERTTEEKSTLHIPDPLDYQGRSFLHIPQDVGVNLKSDHPPEKCYLPKKLIHTWSGHTKAVSSIKLFPRSGHLLLSTSMDCKVKLWQVYNKRKLVRTYSGHNKAVRDASFNNDGTRFLTAGYDRYIKLWDTETGSCISRFSTGKIPYCVKFNPDRNKQHLFVAGLSDKKIVTWDTNSRGIVQEYDRHLGAVNTITFVDNNTKFVSTSDDKSLRVWEWDIPVDFKYIADPGMHSMPSVTLSGNGKWLGCQSLDNQIIIFDVYGRFRVKRKKIFKGHMVAGYACQMTFSPDMSYVASGDGDGKVFIWDWKTTKLFSKFQAHDNVCIGCIWHPHETSKLITSGWDGQIKLWD